MSEPGAVLVVAPRAQDHPMPRTVEGQRRATGHVTRQIDVPAELDRRLVHHARLTRTAYETIMRHALERECARLDDLEETR